MILYKQFNFGLASQTFGLVTSSNSLPEGQPHLFIFVSPCIYCFQTISCLLSRLLIFSLMKENKKFTIVVTRNVSEVAASKLVMS